MTNPEIQSSTFSTLELATRATILLAAATGLPCVAVLPAAEAPPRGVPLRAEYRIKRETDALPDLAEGRLVALYRCHLHRPLPAATAAAYLRFLAEHA